MANSVGVSFGELSTRNHEPLCGGARLLGKGFTNYSERIKAECTWYIPGMIGHAFSAVGKVINLVTTFLCSSYATCKYLYSLGENGEYRETAKDYWMLTLDTLLVLGIDVIGIVAPPLAYRIDDYVIENFVKKTLFPDVVNRYRNPRIVDREAATATDYKVFGLSQGATKAEVKAAYIGLARQYHPDKNNSEGATAKFQAIQVAYDKIRKDPNLA